MINITCGFLLAGGTECGREVITTQFTNNITEIQTVADKKKKKNQKYELGYQ